MKSLTFIFFLLTLMACSSNPDNTSALQEQVDSLQDKLDNSYKPGLGEFMSGIQVHHAKLWFAGTDNNWKLADFEIKEIQEAIGDIRSFNTDRPEVESIGIINPAIDSITKAIQLRDQAMFRSSYTLLTNSCNNCHRATRHEFNVITIPTTPPFSNQSFQSSR